MKKFLFLLITVLVVCNILQAADDVKYVAGGAGRVLALGGSPTNSSILDYTDIYMNPAYALMYSDFIYTELGYDFSGYSASQQIAGFTYSVWKGLSVGLSVGKQEGPAFAINSYGSGVSYVPNVDNFVGGINNLMNSVSGFSDDFTPRAAVHPLQVYAAMKLGGLMVGAGIYRAGWSKSGDYTQPGNTTNTIEEISVGQTGFKAGAILDMDLLVLDASALLRVNSATAKRTPPPPLPGRQKGDKEINATGTELALNARLLMKFSDKFTLIPMARLYTFGYEPELKDTVRLSPTKYNLNSKPNKYSRTDLELGVGSNITVPGGKVFIGLTMESISLKNEYTTFASPWSASLSAPDTIQKRTTKYSAAFFSLPKVSLGAEFEIASWLTGRLGYFKAFSSVTMATEAPAPAKKQEYKWTYDFQFLPSYGMSASSQLLSVGLGIHFDRFAFDGYLCEQWLANGPYIISGQGTAMFGVLSMSYSFN